MNPYQPGGGQPYGPPGGYHTQPQPQPGWNPPPPPSSGRGPLIAMLAAVGVVAVILAGVVIFLLTRSDDTPRANPPVTSQSTPAASTPQSTGSVVGVWQGNYVCNQGRTSLRLTISQGSGDQVSAIFDFYATADNSVPSGSFVMKGSFANGSLRLTGDHWLHQPDGYFMVGLNAEVSDSNPTTISGSVAGSGCTTFTVTKAGS